MGMRIGSSDVMAMQSTAMNQTSQKQQHVSNLFSALDSGDLASAQKSYSALGLSSGTTGMNSPLAQIGKALDSGDLAGAQKVAKSMKSKDTSAVSEATATTTATNIGNTKPATQSAPSASSDLASELLSDFSSASSVLGLGGLVNKLV